LVTPNVPYGEDVKITNEYVEMITSKVMKHRKDRKILIHCSLGNRVAIWLGAYKKNHKFSNKKITPTC
jgi:rhodanese-related sulfurtransferase